MAKRGLSYLYNNAYVTIEDHELIKRISAEDNYAPLRHLQMLIEYKSPLLYTLMLYVPRDQKTIKSVRATVDYLIKWEKYTGAIPILLDWLDLT